MSSIDTRRILPAKGIHGRQMVAFFTMSILYLFYYFCKYNLGVATPYIQKEYGFSSTTFGLLLSVFALVYAGGQFLNGYLGDRYGPKKIMIMGGIGGVIVSVAFGLIGKLPFLPAGMLGIWFYFLILWGMNGYFSSCGWAPGSRIMYNWFPEKRWGTWMGIYNALCYTGGGLVSVVAGFAIANTDSFTEKMGIGNLQLGWRAAFLIPPIFLLIMTIIFWIFGKNSPADAGLKTEWEPPHAVVRKHPGRKEYRLAFFNSKMLFAYASGFGANIVRYGGINWMVKILAAEVWVGGFGIPIARAATIASMAHFGGAFFSLVLGWVTDRVFKGARWQTITLGFILGAVPLFWMAQGSGIIGYSTSELTAADVEARYGKRVLEQMIPGMALEVHESSAGVTTTQPASQPADRTGPVLFMKTQNEWILADGNPLASRLWLMAIAMFISGGLIQAVQTPLFDLPGDILGEELGGTGVGILDGWMYLGAAFAGVFMGWWLDHYSLMAGLKLMGVVAVIAGLLALPIRK